MKTETVSYPEPESCCVGSPNGWMAVTRVRPGSMSGTMEVGGTAVKHLMGVRESI